MALTPGTIGERLAEARHRSFVGRDRELDLFRSVLGGELAYAVLFVHGPGGVGKTSLLGALADVARGAGVGVARVDVRAVGASPPAFLGALAEALGAPDTSGVVDALGADGRFVVFVDTYEAAGGLDAWLREELLPGLPGQVLVVIAGRDRPSPAWLADPGWRDLTCVLRLGNLGADEARRYMRLAGLPESAHDDVVRLTHGHPLALSLGVDVLSQRGEGGSPGPLPDLAGAPDLVRVLLARFVDDVPGDRHRHALEVCAHARYTTEELLATVLGDDGEPGRSAGPTAHELFSWLRRLSFVEEAPRGLFPHDLARDVLDADLRWRDPGRYSELHRRVRAHLLERAQRSGPAEQQQASADILFLHRTNPRVAAFLDWGSFDRAYIDVLRPEDRGAIMAMTERHEGPESAALVVHWMQRQPGAFRVFREGSAEAIGYTALLALHEADEGDRATDPGVRAMCDYAERRGRPVHGEQVMGLRFFVDRDAYQGPSPSFNLMSACGIQHVVTGRRLAWSFAGCFADPDSVAPLFADIDYHRAVDADFEVGGRRYGFFAHDFRRVPVEAWIELTGDREITSERDPALAPAAPPTSVVLPEPEFHDAVRQALRDLHRPERLARSPLLHTRLARSRGGGEPSPEVLAGLLREAARTLQAHPRDEKLYRALDRTYLRPAETQERAAELLDLPFSTYRRHLTRAVEHVTQRLRAIEVAPPPRTEAE